MRRRLYLVSVFLLILPTLLIPNCSVSSQAALNPRSSVQQTLTSETVGVINIDGDVSMTEERNRICWNPHSTGLTSASTWRVTFRNETEILLKATTAEAGHVATGAWWATGFKTNQKLQLYTSKPVQLVAVFRANVVSVDCQSGNEWLRIALACAVQRIDGSVVYTEMDFWDSPNVLSSPFGNIASGGAIVYRGGDVVEYKIGQATLGEWKDYSIELSEHINSAWLLKQGDVLESVYVVVEVIGGVSVTVKVDDLWIAQLD